MTIWSEAILEDYYRGHREEIIKRISARKFIDCVEDAEDVVQEAFTKALAYIHSFDIEEARFPTWFNAVVNNCYKDFIREKMQRVDSSSYPGNEEFDEEQFPVDDPALELPEQMIDKAKEEIAKRPFPLREVLTMYFLQNMKPSDIVCVVEDYTVGSVRTLIHNFKHEMRKAYG